MFNKQTTEYSSDKGAPVSGDGLYRVWIWCFLGAVMLWTFLYVSILKGPAGDSIVLVLLGAGALLIVVYFVRSMFNLRSDNRPVWLTILIAASFIATVMGLSLLHDSGIIFWPNIYTYLPLAIIFSGISVGALVTEARCHVRVYDNARGFVYLRKS